MNDKNNIKNPRFRLVDSTLKGYKEVEVVFNYNGEDHKYFIFIDEGKNVNYINEAKKQFNQDVKSGKVLKTINVKPTNHRPWLIAGASVLGVATITFASLFAWKALTNGGVTPEPQPDPSNYVTLTLNAGEGNTVEGTKNKIFKYYVEKGTTVADTFKTLHYKGAASENNDFLYWTINNQPIDMEYVINEDINLVPVYKPVQTDCLTITARQDDLSINFTTDKNLQVSFDRADWHDVTSDAIVLEHAGDQVYIKREDESALNSKIISSSNKLHSVSGHIETLVGGKTSGLADSVFKSCFQGDSNLISANNLNLGNITLASQCYYSMFSGCSSLTTAPALPAINLAESCYQSMFYGCSSLTTAPALPASDLTDCDFCYYSMFSGCSSLTTAPALPAMNLASYCYYYMFCNCSSLTTAPALPASDLTDCDFCYYGMFYNCSSLTTAPALPAMNLAKNCYQNMFYGCSSLTTAPALPASDLTDCDSCYDSMFYNCSSLTTASALPAMDLAKSCYQSMFYGCSSLTTAPALPAMDLTKQCYYRMFYNCSSLTTAPALQAPNLTDCDSCYAYMFQNCSSLTTAPALPAMNLVRNCYQNMFYGCSSLTTAPALQATTLANSCYQNMFYGCSSLKIIEKEGAEEGLNKIFTCPSSIPNDAVTNMFKDTTGTFTGGTPTAEKTYYWYTE